MSRPSRSSLRVRPAAVALMGAALALATIARPSAMLAQSPRSEADPILDPAFGQGGIAVADLGDSDDAPRGVAVDVAGRATVAGAARPDANSLVGFAAARFTPDGRLDAAFGEGGLVHVQLGEGQ